MIVFISDEDTNKPDISDSFLNSTKKRLALIISSHDFSSSNHLIGINKEDCRVLMEYRSKNHIQNKSLGSTVICNRFSVA